MNNKLTTRNIILLTMVAWTVMFVEIYRLTNSIWPAVLLHAVEDSLINPLIIDGHIIIASGMEIVISPICGIIPTTIYLLIGLWLRKIRISNTPIGFDDPAKSSVRTSQVF